ncbi:MAG: response regulator transcription factor [Pseudomonadota bacterium]|nr:response regulator transcription factor [Pseudomonadota bacterium]
MRLLIVEDSAPLSTALLASLQREGYVCDHASDGEAAIRFVGTYDYDLLVLDLMLPRLDGFAVLRAVRQRSYPTWVLVLSARDQVADRVAALDSGANDYLVKPFALDELLARLRALSRRPTDNPRPILSHGDLHLEILSRVARWRGADLQLSPKEFALLELLLRSRGRVLSRTQIFERLYESASSSSDKAVEVIMSTLRAKLVKAGAGDPVQTRRGFGYVIA